MHSLFIEVFTPGGILSTPGGARGSFRGRMCPVPWRTRGYAGRFFWDTQRRPSQIPSAIPQIKRSAGSAVNPPQLTADQRWEHATVGLFAECDSAQSVEMESFGIIVVPRRPVLPARPFLPWQGGRFPAECWGPPFSDILLSSGLWRGALNA